VIGNDIVDLNLAKTQSNWQRKGFLNKIFTKKEQEFIKNANDSFKMVWLLWSMKESAYKIYNRQLGKRFFAPKKFECNINSSQNTVNIEGIVYYTKSTISNDSIHTIAQLNPNKLIRKECFKLESSSYSIQHINTNYNLRFAIADQFNIPLNKVKIDKDRNGIPCVNYKNVTSSPSTLLKTGSVEGSLISISHHGVFGAYAFAL